MELWDVYDKNRNFTGRIVGQDTPLKDDEYRIAIKVAIFNQDGEMLIQKRQLSNPKYPNLWDVSVVGNVIHEENSEDAVERELFEKLGIKEDFLNERPIFTIYKKETFDDFYILNLDIDINLLKINHKEVQSVTWASKHEILQLIEEEKFVPYNEGLIELLFFNKDCRGIIYNGR